MIYPHIIQNIIRTKLSTVNYIYHPNSQFFHKQDGWIKFDILMRISQALHLPTLPFKQLIESTYDELLHISLIPTPLTDEQKTSKTSSFVKLHPNTS